MDWAGGWAGDRARGVEWMRADLTNGLGAERTFLYSRHGRLFIAGLYGPAINRPPN